MTICQTHQSPLLVYSKSRHRQSSTKFLPLGTFFYQQTRKRPTKLLPLEAFFDSQERQRQTPSLPPKIGFNYQARKRPTYQSLQVFPLYPALLRRRALNLLLLKFTLLLHLARFSFPWFKKLLKLLRLLFSRKLSLLQALGQFLGLKPPLSPVRHLSSSFRFLQLLLYL
jgi:hypothetical protein